MKTTALLVACFFAAAYSVPIVINKKKGTNQSSATELSNPLSSSVVLSETDQQKRKNDETFGQIQQENEKTFVEQQSVEIFSIVDDDDETPLIIKLQPENDWNLSQYDSNRKYNLQETIPSRQDETILKKNIPSKQKLRDSLQTTNSKNTVKIGENKYQEIQFQQNSEQQAPQYLPQNNQYPPHHHQSVTKNNPQDSEYPQIHYENTQQKQYNQMPNNENSQTNYQYVTQLQKVQYPSQNNRYSPSIFQYLSNTNPHPVQNTWYIPQGNQYPQQNSHQLIHVAPSNYEEFHIHSSPHSWDNVGNSHQPNEYVQNSNRFAASPGQQTRTASTSILEVGSSAVNSIHNIVAPLLQLGFGG